MLRLKKNLRQNSIVLLVICVFCAVGFVTAQTRPAKKPTAPTAKKTPAPTPKKTDKKPVTAKSSDKKDSDKKSIKATDKKSSTAKTASEKSKSSKTSEKQSAKTSSKTNSQVSKTAAKTPTKNSASGASSKSFSGKKSAEKTARVTETKATKAVAKPSPTKSTASNSSSAPSQAIVIVSAARVRAEPNTNSAEVRRMKLGTLVKVVDENPSWYKIELPNSANRSGWMSKQIVGEYSDEKRETIYRNITERNFKSEKMAFADAAELYEFLSRAQDEVKTQPLASEIAYKRFLTLRSALKNIPFGKSSEKPYSDFLKTHDKSVVYSEPSGEWYVRSELLWDAQKKYSKEPISEEIAWTAAQNPLPGECEGYINCYLFFLRETDGEYLTLYPNGKYAEQSLKNIQNLLEPISADLSEKKVYTGPSDVSDRAEFNRLIAELRTIVSKLPFAEIEKQKTIQQLNRIAEGYR